MLLKYSIMGKVRVIKDKKTGQIKYETILPKPNMEDLAVQSGDELILKSVVGNEITFKLRRHSLR